MTTSKYAGMTFRTFQPCRMQKLARQLRKGTARIVTTCAESDPMIGPYWVIDDLDLQITWHVPQRRRPRWGQMYGIHERLP
jgi:hypothetical protein